jgi:hypothetical protein
LVPGWLLIEQGDLESLGGDEQIVPLPEASPPRSRAALNSEALAVVFLAQWVAGEMRPVAVTDGPERMRH